MKRIEFTYVVESFYEKFLVRSIEGYSLKSKNDFNGKDDFTRSLLTFPSPEEAEEFIWKHSLLNVDVTLRPVLI